MQEISNELNFTNPKGVNRMGTWHDKLAGYFPAKEMKTKEHMETLFKERGELYRLEEGQDYVLMYLEKPDFIFIDYILITGENRGKGLGSKLIARLKRKNKPIVLEVDPVCESDPVTKKRVHFYERNGFRKAENIGYERIHVVTGELNVMDIFCWSPHYVTEQWIYEKMKTAYSEVHTFRAEEVYGKTMQPVSDVIWMKTSKYRRAE